jgi:hypothetical protein
MSLTDKLAAIREMALQRIPAEALKVMHAATSVLRDSGILAGAIKVGQPLPPFALAGARGNTVTSLELLSHGPLVLSVFRGHW